MKALLEEYGLGLITIIVIIALALIYNAAGKQYGESQIDLFKQVEGINIAEVLNNEN